MKTSGTAHHDSGHTVDGPGLQPVVDIVPNRPWWILETRELWARRYLYRLLVAKDLLAAHKQSVLGPVWFIIQPIITAMLFALVFGRFAGLTPHGVPRFLFYLAATVPWTFFQSVALGVSGSLAANTQILGKVYFPRLIAPLVSASVTSIHFVINYGVFVAFYLVYGSRSGHVAQFPLWGAPTALLLVLCAGMGGLGTGMLFASAGVRYRDFRIALPIILQTWMFATPIIYPSDVVPPKWRLLFFANPMAGIVETHRHLFFGTARPDTALILLGTGVAVLLLITGLFAFNRTQRTFIDII
jgi:lipopolysaccharide transport system permease protein